MVQKVEIDVDTCINCGHCYGSLDAVFEEIKADNHAAVKADADLNNPEIADVAGGCPVGAIIVEE